MDYAFLRSDFDNLERFRQYRGAAERRRKVERSPSPRPSPPWRGRILTRFLGYSPPQDSWRRPQPSKNVATPNPLHGGEGMGEGGQIPFQPIGSNSNNLIPPKTARNLFLKMALFKNKPNFHPMTTFIIQVGNNVRFDLLRFLPKIRVDRLSPLNLAFRI